MKRTFKLAMAGAVAALALVGCKDTRSYDAAEGTGGSGTFEDRNAPINQDVRMDEHPAPRIGDGKIGNENGVIDDGEGPLEQDGVVDDKMGENPGVWNDNEGPVENTEADRPEAQ